MGQTVSVEVVPKDVPEPTLYQFKVYEGAPVGVKRHASGVPFTEKVVWFLPGGETATVAAAF